MTRERLIQLRDQLSLNGWWILNEMPESEYDSDIFYVDREEIVWGIRHATTDQEIELRMRVFDGMGRWTGKVQDVWCCVASTGEHLYFSKIRSRDWIEDHVAFAASIGSDKATIEKASPTGPLNDGAKK